MKEAWKHISGYDRKYSVSNLGKIKNNITKRLLTLTHKGDGYISIRLNYRGHGKTYLVHRLVAIEFCKDEGVFRELQVDHIDGNKTNNSSDNLRFVTSSQNSWNRGVSKRKKSSQFRGVYKNPHKGWKVEITKDYKTYFLGCYYTELEAAKVYNSKASELYGKFARLNVV